MALRFKLGGTRPRQNINYYIPTSLKPAFLVFLLSYICLLIALLEYARRTLPVLRERPPIPGEIVPAVTIPLITETPRQTASGFGKGVVVLAPHPPTSAFQGIDVPAFSTAYWGLSIRDAWIHSLTTDRLGARLTSISAVGQDPYASGRCAMAVIEMSFTNNPEDCVALVEQTLFHNHALEYNVHLLDRECFTRALEFDWAYQQNWYWGGGKNPMVLFPDCWEEEERATKILTGVSNVFSGRTAVMEWKANSVTSYDSTASFVLVNTATPGGWPLGFNQHEDGRCWRIFSTPFHENPYTLGTMVSAGAQYWPGSIPSEPINTWMSQSVIRAYFTEDVWGEASPWGWGETGPTVFRYYYANIHQGCAVTSDASTATSTESIVLTATPAQVVSRSTAGPVLAPSTSASRLPMSTKHEGTSTLPAQTITTSLAASASSVATSSRQSSRNGPESVSGKATHSDVFGPGPVIRSSSSLAVQVLQNLKPPSLHTTTREGQGAPSSSSNTISIPASSPLILGTASDSSLSTTVAISQNPTSSKHTTHQALQALQSDKTNASASANSSPQAQAQPKPSLISDQVLFAPITSSSQSLTRNSTGILAQATTTLRHDTTLASVPGPMPQPTPPPVTKPFIRPMNNTEYLSGLLLPVLLCTLLTAMIQILALNARSIFPFAILTRPSPANGQDGGAEAKDSVLLRLGGISGVMTSLRLLFQIREPLPFLLDLLVLLSVVLTAISTSTVTIGYFGFCDTGSHEGWCYMGVGYYSAMLEAALGVLAAMAVVLLAVLVLRSRLRVAINANSAGLGKCTSPWAVSNIARLSVTVPDSGPDGRIKGLRDLLEEIRSPALSGPGDVHVASRKSRKLLEGQAFRIGSHRGRDGLERYSILAYKKSLKTPADQQSCSPTVRGVKMVETHELQSIITSREHDNIPLPVGFLSIAHDWDLNSSSKRTSRTSQRSLLRTIATTPAMTEEQDISARTSADVTSFQLPLQDTDQTDIRGAPDRPATPIPPAVTGRVLPAIDVTGQSDEVRHHIASSPGSVASTGTIFYEHRPCGTGPGSIRGSVMTFETQEYTQSVASGYSQRRLLQVPGPSSVTTFANITNTKIPAPPAPPPAVPLPHLPTFAIPIQPQHLASDRRKSSRRFRNFNGHLVFQTTVLLLLTGLFILITYYESVEINLVYFRRHQIPFTLAASFEAFMDSQSIGVSVLFTSLAVGITLFWDYFFSWVVVDSQMAGYHHRVRRRQQPGRPLLDLAAPAPPITVFGGFALSMRSFFSRVRIGKHISKKGQQQQGAEREQGHRNSQPLVSLGAVSLAGILSKGIPILMSHIPFRQYQTWRLHLATAWMTVAILGYMVFVLGTYLALMAVAWSKTRDRKGKLGLNKRTVKELGIKTDCIVGVVYYLMCTDEYHNDEILFGMEMDMTRS